MTLEEKISVINKNYEEGVVSEAFPTIASIQEDLNKAKTFVKMIKTSGNLTAENIRRIGRSMDIEAVLCPSNQAIYCEDIGVLSNVRVEINDNESISRFDIWCEYESREFLVGVNEENYKKEYLDFFENHFELSTILDERER